MRTIITFLNDKPPKSETRYTWEGREYGGCFFCQALRQFVEHDRMLVCITPQAEQLTWPILLTMQDPRIQPVPIPIGKSASEMWLVYDAIAARIHEGETVIFDITQGLRSLSFLMFLFAAYLKSAKKVKIEAIYYGALELGQPAPVVDMSEFVTMLDWLTATDQFVQTGDARRLAMLLNPSKNSGGVAAEAAKALSSVSLAAFLCQPFRLMSAVSELDTALCKAETELALMSRPFGILRDQVVEAFSPFSADFWGNVPGGLRAQFRLIEWYYSNNQLIQAMTLAREWLVNAVTYRLGLPIDLRISARKPIERAISGVAMVGREMRDEETKEAYTFRVSDLNEYGRKIYETWPEREELKELWDALEKVRNALAHAGHQASAMQIETIVKKADTKVMPPLRQFAKDWGLS